MKPDPKKPSAADSPTPEKAAPKAISGEATWVKHLKVVEDFEAGDFKKFEINGNPMGKYELRDGHLYVSKTKLDKYYGLPLLLKQHEVQPGQSFAISFRLPKGQSKATGFVFRVGDLRLVIRTKNATAIAVSTSLDKKPQVLETISYESDNGKPYHLLVHRRAKLTHYQWQLVTPGSLMYSGRFVAQAPTDRSDVTIQGSSNGDGEARVWLDDIRIGNLPTEPEPLGREFPMDYSLFKPGSL